MIRAMQKQGVPLGEKLKEDEESYLSMMQLTGQQAAESAIMGGGEQEANLHYAFQAAYDNHQNRVQRALSGGQFRGQL